MDMDTDTGPDERLDRLEEALDEMGQTDPCIREVCRVLYGALLAAQEEGQAG